MSAAQTNEQEKTETKSKPRGFAAMSPERQRAIARIGGIAAHKKGTAHEFTSTEASAAGRKGGLAVSKDQLHMALIGRKGGLARKRAESSDDGVGQEKSS
jgi:general stress protein YciG